MSRRDVGGGKDLISRPGVVIIARMNKAFENEWQK